MSFALLWFIFIGVTSKNFGINSSLEKGKKYLAEGYLTKAKQYADESQDESLIKQVHHAKKLYQLAVSNKTSLKFSMDKYLELINICHKSKEFHMNVLNISLRLNNDTLFDSIYQKLKIIAPEDIEILAMKGFKNLKNARFSNAKTYFNEYKKQSSKYSQIIKDIDLLEKSFKDSINYLSKEQTEKTLKSLQTCQKIMLKYSISEDSILSKEIRKIDIDILILTEKYEDAVKQLNELISQTDNDEFLYIKRGNILFIHKDYAGCISDLEKVLELTNDKEIEYKVQNHLNNAKKNQEKERKINYYSIFGLNPGADINDVKKSYHKLAIHWHPDRFKEILKKKRAEKNMKLINRAFDIIGNEEKKHIYDFCHGYTDIPPVIEDQRGFFSKLFNINEVDVWSVCYEDEYQFTGKPTKNEESNDSTNSSEQFTDSSEQSKSTNDNNSSESKNNQESQNDSDNTIFGLIFYTIVYEIAKKIILHLC